MAFKGYHNVDGERVYVTYEYLDLGYSNRRLIMNGDLFPATIDLYISLSLIDDIDFPLGFRLEDNKLYYDLGDVNLTYEGNYMSYEPFGRRMAFEVKFAHSEFGSFILDCIGNFYELKESNSISIFTFDNIEILLNSYYTLNNNITDIKGLTDIQRSEYSFAFNKGGYLTAFKVNSDSDSYSWSIGSWHSYTLPPIGSVYNCPHNYGNDFDNFLFRYSNSNSKFISPWKSPSYLIHAGSPTLTFVRNSSTSVSGDSRILGYVGSTVSFVEYYNSFILASQNCCLNLNFNPIVKFLGGE